MDLQKTRGQRQQKELVFYGAIQLPNQGLAALAHAYVGRAEIGQQCLVKQLNVHLDEWLDGVNDLVQVLEGRELDLGV